MGAIKLENLVKSFGAVEVIRDISLDIPEGELVVFVGPSGCGKSTLLRLISGLDQPTSGRILIDGKDVTRISAADRGLAMVFQSYALYPHMSVRQNMAFGLENTRMPKAEIKTRIDEAARMLEIGPLMDRKPGQLSGGQRQRVAIGRAIVREPVAFLLDEPLSNLDAELRGTMRAELASLHTRLGRTMVYVTHDQIEAMTLADRIVVLRGGIVEQVDTPLNLFNKPANTFVAGFIGAPRMNFIKGENGRTMGIRPQHLRIGDSGISVKVEMAENLGAETLIHASTLSGDPILAMLPGQTQPERGAPLALIHDPADEHWFDASGMRV